MSLDYDFGKVKDYEALHESEEELKVTEAIIFLMLQIPFANITDNNFLDVATAIAMEEQLSSARLKFTVRDDDGNPAGVRDRPITVADVERRIGLHTNCFGHPTKQKFLHTLWNNMLFDKKAEYARIVQERETEQADEA